jgi:PKD repeat protein
MNSPVARSALATRPSVRRARVQRFITGIILFLSLTGVSAVGAAAELTLAWSAVDDPRLTGYELHYGDASGQYHSLVKTSETRTTVQGLQAGKVYYFSVKAIGADRAVDSAFCPELKETIPEPVPQPVADFTANATDGIAPMVVVFDDASTGDVTSHNWDFGDGGSSTGQSAAWTYTEPGTYSVSLHVTGAGGSDTTTKAALIRVSAPAPGPGVGDPDPPGDDGNGTVGDPSLPIEVGEVLVDDQWQWVEFGRRFDNPVVVANPPSFNDFEPATVRISGIESTGFWIRVQEWDYLDGHHDFESIGYIVMERGIHLLPSGDQIEAGTFITAGRAFSKLGFAGTFAKAPVVFASVISDNDSKAVTTRLRNVTRTGFELRMDEQESFKTGHGAETIGYIAWPVSEGTIDGLQYRVGLTTKSVTHRPFTLKFGKGFANLPVFLAHAQSTNGADPATLRYRNRTTSQAFVWIEEERSLDVEIEHAQEFVGWMVFN